MRKKALAWLCCALVLAMNFSPVFAQTEFRKALQAKYNFRTVSCFTCHARVEPGTENPKQYRNDFGKLFDAHLKDKNVTERLNAVKSLSSSDPKKEQVREAVTADFLKALEKVEQQKTPDGDTWAEALKAGKVEGTKLR